MLPLFSLALALLAAPDSVSRTPAITPISQAIAARGMQGDTVTVAGRATVDVGLLQSGALDIAVDDGTGALRVYSRTFQAAVREGDSVVARGVVRPYRGTLELFATTVTVVPAPTRTVAPIKLRLVASAIAANEARLVTLRGAVASSGHSEGGKWLRLVGTQPGDSGGITVWVNANHGGVIPLDAMSGADSVSVTGIITPYRDNPEDPVIWQLVPRTSADVVRLDPVPLSERFGRLGVGLAATLLLLLGALRLGARRNRRALRETNARYQQLLDLSPDAVIVHSDGAILFGNPAAAQMLGVANADALVGRDLKEMLSEESLELVRPKGSWDPGQPGAVSRVRGQLHPVAGAVVDVEVTMSPCRYHDRDASVLLARDITSQLRVERDLGALALLDDLTGLHNRRGFTLLAEQEVTRARRYQRSPLLLFADLDYLKLINDEHGHAAGDEAIRAMSRALRSIVRDSDIVARWGGDEFIALLLDGSEQMAETMSDRLASALAVESAAMPFAVRASVGTTILQATDGESLAEAIDRADAALYKRKGVSRPSPVKGTRINP